MNLKQYAKSRKLTLKQLNDLCKVVLEEVPATLTEDDMAKLDAAAAAAAEHIAALPSSDSIEDEIEQENTAEIRGGGGDTHPPVNMVEREKSEATTDLTEKEDTLPEQEHSTLATSSVSQHITPQTRQVIEVLGEETLKRNVAIFMTHHIHSLQRLSQTHTAILHKFEQDIYHETSNTFARMTRNMEQTFGEAQRIANPKTGEDEQLYQDYLALVDDFLSAPPS